MASLYSARISRDGLRTHLMEQVYVTAACRQNSLEERRCEPFDERPGDDSKTLLKFGCGKSDLDGKISQKLGEVVTKMPQRAEELPHCKGAAVIMPLPCLIKAAGEPQKLSAFEKQL